MTKKRLCDVALVGATVCFFVKEQRVGFLDSTGVIHWIDTASDRAFSKMSFTEGGCVWVYVAREVGKVVSVMYSNGEQISELPQMDPVEL